MKGPFYFPSGSVSRSYFSSGSVSRSMPRAINQYKISKMCTQCPVFILSKNVKNLREEINWT
jgi:hypothetical protein